VLTCASGMINRRSATKRTTPTIERIRSVAASPILEIGLGFVLRFLGFLSAFGVPLNSINMLVNTKLHTLDFRRRIDDSSRKRFFGFILFLSILL
jgi:hypothetical protein